MPYTYNRETLKVKLYDFIYGGALRDAVLQKAFENDRTWIGEIDESKSILKTYILQMLDGGFSDQNNHDEFFLKTANDLCEKINSSNKRPEENKRDFSFGNAQKLINIAVKHTYMLCWGNESLREKFRFCHCPIDSIMLARVWSLCKENNIHITTKEHFCKAWGSEGLEDKKQPTLQKLPERYVKFQEAVRELIKNKHGNIYPIEFDYIEWKNGKK